MQHTSFQETETLFLGPEFTAEKVQIHTDFSTIRNLRYPVATIGTFDGVHKGHRSILARLKELANENQGESIVLTFYPHPRMVLQPDLTGLRLINSPDEKARLFREAGVDHLVVYPFSEAFSRLSPEEYVRDLLVVGIGVKKLVVGYDHRFGRNREGDIQSLRELSDLFGFGVEEIPAQKVNEIRVSSTKIRNALAIGDVAAAAEGLGYRYSVTGTVVKGNGKGKEIGFPTANIEPLYPLKLIPGRGVYVVNVTLDETKMNGLLNIGVRPTVTDENKEVIEVHVPGLDQNLVGKVLTLHFIERLRDEKKFGSIDELVQQIKMDKLTAEKIFAAQ